MIPEALKAQQWEIAKGHLRALVALQGSIPADTAPEHLGEIDRKWEELLREVEAFITRIEDNALQE